VTSVAGAFSAAFNVRSFIPTIQPSTHLHLIFRLVPLMANKKRI